VLSKEKPGIESWQGMTSVTRRAGSSGLPAFVMTLVGRDHALLAHGQSVAARVTTAHRPATSLSLTAFSR